MIGFAQSLFALDAADGESDGGEVVINALVQALIGFVISVELSRLTMTVHLTLTPPTRDLATVSSSVQQADMLT